MPVVSIMAGPDTRVVTATVGELVPAQPVVVAALCRLEDVLFAMSQDGANLFACSPPQRWYRRLLTVPTLIPVPE